MSKDYVNTYLYTYFIIHISIFYKSIKKLKYTHSNNRILEYHEILGYYTYRSFLDNPLPVDDFNRIKFAEAELFLLAQDNGTLTGTLSFPADEFASEKLFMDITGTIKNQSSRIILEFIGQGRSNTVIFDFLYEYSCSVAFTWEKGIGQRLSLTGTLLRSQDHGSGDQIAKAGATASFIAVKRDFIEPRDINGVALIPNALSMLSSKSHRLIHTVWHTLRFNGLWNSLNEEERNEIIKLGWNLKRQPFVNGLLNLSNGAGEDFLFMHRKMIKMVHDEYDSKGVQYIERWKTLPLPEVPQISYSEYNDPENPENKIYRFNPLESGNMIPPPFKLPEDTEDDFENLKFLKSSAYFRSVMRHLEGQFTDPRYLSNISLGALGNLLEFTIHNQMHGRWSSIPRDPETGDPSGRPFFDFQDKFDNPKNDFLGDFYSSHVNPVFWKLHGWIDDRIEDWFNAHENAHPGEIERYDYEGVAWFKKGKWVEASDPLYWPEHQHGHNNNQQQYVDNLLRVMKIIENSLTRDARDVSETAKRRFSLLQRKFGSIPFLLDINTTN